MVVACANARVSALQLRRGERERPLEPGVAEADARVRETPRTETERPPSEQQDDTQDDTEPTEP